MTTGRCPRGNSEGLEKTGLLNDHWDVLESVRERLVWSTGRVVDIDQDRGLAMIFADPNALYKIVHKKFTLMAILDSLGVIEGHWEHKDTPRPSRTK